MWRQQCAASILKHLLILETRGLAMSQTARDIERGVFLGPRGGLVIAQAAGEIIREFNELQRTKIARPPSSPSFSELGPCVPRDAREVIFVFNIFV